MVESVNNNIVRILDIADKRFFETYQQFFSSNQEFIIVCVNKNSINKCRRAINLFFEFEKQRPKGWKRLKTLGRLLFIGMPFASVLAVCNKAFLLDWEVIVLTEGNHVLHLCPRFDANSLKS